MMTEKRYMVRKFWRMLVDQARKIFNEARSDTERWLAAVPLPLETQIETTRRSCRPSSLAKVNERGGAINEEVQQLQTQRKEIQRQIQMIRRSSRKVRDVGPSADGAAGDATMRVAGPAMVPVASAAPVTAAMPAEPMPISSGLRDGRGEGRNPHRIHDHPKTGSERARKK